MPTTDELNAEVRCLTCAGLSQYQSISLAFYQRWLLALNPAADVSLNGLTAYAACYGCLGLSLYETLQIAMLSQIEIATVVSSFAARAEITDETQIAALNTLVTNAHVNGWWGLCDLIYPFAGGTALAHSQNLKSSSFTIAWAGTVTHDANGITGDGSTGYGDTGYIPGSSGQATLNSGHFGMYRRNAGNNGRSYSGVHDASTSFRFQKFFGTSIGVSVNSLSNASISSSVFRFSAGVRNDASSTHLFHDGIDTSAASASVSNPTLPIFILASNAAGTPVTFSTANLAFLTAGSGITFAEYEQMASDIQAFQTALSRQV